MNKFIVLLGLITLSQAQITDSIGNVIVDGIVDVKNPIEAALLAVITTQCENLKKLLGVSYEQLDETDEPDPKEVTLNYISKDTNISYNILDAAEQITQSEDFYRDEKLIIFIHGSGGKANGTSFLTLNTAFTSIGEDNVLALDAESLLKRVYVRSTTYVRFIGEYLGKALADFVKAGVHPEKIHLLGHGIGAHIAGFAGKTFKSLTGLLIGWITGLDPAGPCYTKIDDALRLNATDAAYVDVIHTDAGVYGMFDPLGHADYYPNRGAQQPGCLKESCSHDLSWKFYNESIYNPEAFPAVKCNSWEDFKKDSCSGEISYMGYGSKNSQGKFYLVTSDSSPYSFGFEGTTSE